MKRERTDLIVGLVVITAVALFGATLWWIVPGLMERSYPLYSEFQDVEGIGVHAPVYLHGYRIGYVDAIEPVVGADGSLTFRVRMAINRRLESGAAFHLPVGTQALLTPPPIPIGAGWVRLSFPPAGGAPLAPGATIAGRRAPVAMDQIQALSVSLGQHVVETTTAARALMDTLTNTATSVNRSVATSQAAIPGVLQQLQMQLAATEALTTETRGHLNALTPAAIAGLDSAAALLADSRSIVQQATGVLGSSEAQIHGILANLDTTSMLVESLMRQFSQRPLRVIFSGAKPGDAEARRTLP